MVERTSPKVEPPGGPALESRLGRRGLRWRKLSDEVAATLRNMILVGELPPAERTTQDELARLLGVSTMPVREALLRLAEEGFVEAAAGRSFRITRTTPKDIRDLYWIHAMLAGELTRRACANADEALLVRLRENHEQITDARSYSDVNSLTEVANWAFHKDINLAADSPKLLRTLRSSLRFIPQGFYALVPEWTGVSNRGHAEIVEAFERHDPEAAGRAAEQHVREAGELLIAHFSSQGFWIRPDSS